MWRGWVNAVGARKWWAVSVVMSVSYYLPRTVVEKSPDIQPLAGRILFTIDKEGKIEDSEYRKSVSWQQ